MYGVIGDMSLFRREKLSRLLCRWTALHGPGLWNGHGEDPCDSGSEGDAVVVVSRYQLRVIRENHVLPRAGTGRGRGGVVKCRADFVTKLQLQKRGGQCRPCSRVNSLATRWGKGAGAG